MTSPQIEKYFLFSLLILTSVFLSRCANSSDAPGSGTGTGGSLNRFTIIDSFLYVINQSHIECFNIDNGHMEFVAATKVDNDLETLFPFDSLVLAGGNQGMYICARRSDGSLELVSSYEHIRSCDPVVTDGHYAYVTLSSGCWAQNDQLDILDVTDIQNPRLLKSYQMYNPKGLGLDGDLLFICDTGDGLKVYDRSDPVNITLRAHFKDLYPFDVIPYQGLLFVMTENSIHQFNYTDPANIYEISETLLK
jgi:hypothetical protein